MYKYKVFQYHGILVHAYTYRILWCKTNTDGCADICQYMALRGTASCNAKKGPYPVCRRTYSTQINNACQLPKLIKLIKSWDHLMRPLIDEQTD